MAVVYFTPITPLPHPPHPPHSHLSHACVGKQTLVRAVNPSSSFKVKSFNEVLSDGDPVNPPADSCPQYMLAENKDVLTQQRKEEGVTKVSSRGFE